MRLRAITKTCIAVALLLFTQCSQSLAALASTNPTGYQTRMPTHGEPFFIMNGRQKGDENDILKGVIIDQAIGHHSRFIEVFYDDSNNQNFHEIFAEAHELLNRNGKNNHGTDN